MALKLDYYRLKRHLNPETAAARPTVTRRPKASHRDVSFVELAPLAEQVANQCELEFANAQGARLVFRWKGSGTPDLATLGQVFWKG